MPIAHTTEVYNALYAPIYNSGAPGGLHEFNFDDKEEYRDTPDKNDARNLLLNILDLTYNKLLTFTPRLLGISIGRVYSTNAGLPRVTYTVIFNLKDTKTNTLVDEPQLDALSTFVP